MPTHKQRKIRKIKKEIKRKIQNKQRSATAGTNNKTNNKMEDMLKMIMLMRNGQQQQSTTAANELLTAKEMMAKQNQEQARKERESKNEISKIERNIKIENDKAKIQELNQEIEHKNQELKDKNEVNKLKGELRKLENQAKQAKNEQEKKILQEEYDLKKRELDASLALQALAPTEIEQKHELEKLEGEIKIAQVELQKRKQELNIEAIESHQKRLANDLAELKSQITTYSTVTNHKGKDIQQLLNDIEQLKEFVSANVLDNFAKLKDVQDNVKKLLKINLDQKLVNSKNVNTGLIKNISAVDNELAVLIDKNKQLQEATNEKGKLINELKTKKRAIRLEKAYTQLNDEDELEVQVDTISTNPERKWIAEKDYDPKKHTIVNKDIDKLLSDTTVTNKKLKTAIKQKDAEYDRNERDLLKIGELRAEKRKSNAYNEAMGNVQYEDKSQEIAQLEVAIQDAKDKINDKNCTKADYNKYNRKIVELTRKRDELIKQEALIPKRDITEQQITERALIESDIAKHQDEINKKNADNKLYDEFNAETNKIKLQNKLTKAKNTSSADRLNNENEQQIIRNRVAAEKEAEYRDAERKNIELENIKREKELQINALHSDDIKASEEKILQERVKQAKIEKEIKALERVSKAQEAVQQSQATLDVYKELTNLPENTQGIEDVEALLTAANDRMQSKINDNKNGEKYVKEQNEMFRDILSKDPALLDHIITVFSNHEITIDGPDWYAQNLTTREQTDLFGNIVEGVRSAYDSEHNEWNEELLENNEDINKNMNLLLNSE